MTSRAVFDYKKKAPAWSAFANRASRAVVPY